MSLTSSLATSSTAEPRSANRSAGASVTPERQTSVLVVDDDQGVRDLLTEYLTARGMNVRQAANGNDLRAAMDEELPDLVLLDLGLPGEDGLSLARYLRQNFDVGILMITGSSEVIDRVVGLEVGADDYVTKPFDPRELLARMKSVLRRTQARESAAHPATPELANPRQKFGRCEVSLESRQLFDMESGGEEVAMTAMEYELIRLFLANPNRLLSRDQLLMKTRNREWEPFDRSIDIRIGRLRRKIEKDPSSEPKCIRTVRSGGYMYVPG